MENVYDISFSDIVEIREQMPHKIRTDNHNTVLLEIDGFDYDKIQEQKQKCARLKIDALRNNDMGYFCCVLQGHIDMEINGRTYKLEAGEFSCLFKGDYFKLNDASRDVKLFMLLSGSGEHMFKLSNTMMLLSFRDKLEQSRCYGMQPATAKAITMLYGLMCETLEDNNLLYKEIIMQEYLHILFYYLSSDLMRGEKLSPTSVPSRREELLMQFTRLVSENFKVQRKVKYYADKMCLTPKYLSTIVYETGGKYARDIIAEFVIIEAKRLLVNTTMTVQEIGDALHFSCQSFFGKYFREHTGMTPQEYRQTQR